MPSEEPDLLIGERATLVGIGLPTFLKAPWVACDTAILRAHDSRAAFLGIPFDQATVYRSGGNQGPRAIRTASDQFLPYHSDYDVNLMSAYNLVDCGDVPIIPANPERSRGVVREYVGRVLDSGAFAICCGGDHSLPIAIGAALSERVPNFGYLHLDAHLDAAQDVAGERCTNWSGVSRIAEMIDPGHIAIMGIRGLANPPEQFRYVAEQGIRVFTMREILDRGVDAPTSEALRIVTEGTDGFYVSWDLDVIDPAYAPGTNGSEPGGITSLEALRIAHLIGLSRPRILEIAELIPAYDPTFITAKLACYLIFNILAAMATNVPPTLRNQGASL